MAFLPEMPIARLSSSTRRASGVYSKSFPFFSRRTFSSVHPAATLVRSFDADVAHDRLQRPAVLRDLDGQLRQGLGEL